MTEISSVVVTRRVKPGCEDAYETLLNGLLEDSKKLHGFLGAQVLRPDVSSHGEYHITLRFDSEKARKQWESSADRQGWVEGMKALAEEPTVRVLTGLEAWFTLPADGHTKVAPKYRTAVVVWIAIFPTVLLLSTLVARLPLALPRVLSVFVITMISVPLAVYVLLPRLTRFLASWMYK